MRLAKLRAAVETHTQREDVYAICGDMPIVAQGVLSTPLRRMGLHVISGKRDELSISLDWLPLPTDKSTN